MKAVDTNILVRFVIRDDEAQVQLAMQVLVEPCFISCTVLLETAWVLSSRYQLTREDLSATLNDLVRLPSVTVSNAETIGWAIERFAAGADFADMMHLVSAHGADGFVTFDRRLARAAGPAAPLPIEILA